MKTFLEMFPIQASTHAAEVDHMTILVHWLMLVPSLTMNDNIGTPIHVEKPAAAHTGH